MAEGRVTGSTRDTELAATFGFQPGDIVFRLGSRNLARLIRNPVTHGGIYLGDGLIHDMVGFGNRTVTVSNFYAEADDPSVVKTIRFTGPYRAEIVSRLLSNVRARDFDLPTDSKPWNLFSSADDYRTATCLEYSHAQFLYAIRDLVTDTTTSERVRAGLRATYYTSGASRPSDLISPQTIGVSGEVGQAGLLRTGLIAAADYMADDVDPTVFENRWEGETEIENVGSDWLTIMLQHERLRSFTYQSFVDSRQFFTVVR